MVLGDGTVLAEWSQATSVGGDETPYVGVSSGGGTQQTALDVASSTAAQPVVAASDDGSVRLAVWKSMSGAVRQLHWSRWTGSAWTPAATLMNNVSATVEVDLQLTRDGSFGVLSAVSTGGSLFAFRFDGATFAGPDTLAVSGSTAHPVVAVAGRAERAIVGWVQLPSGGGSATQFYGRRWTGSAWSDGVMSISQEPTGRSTVQGSLGMSADGGQAMAAWRSQQAGSWTVAAATAVGQVWTLPAPLGAQTYVNVGMVDVALSENASDAQAVFSAKTSGAGDNVYVMSNRFSGGAWSGSSVRAGPFRTEADPHPSLAMARDGSRGLIVYQEWDSSNNKRARSLRFGDGAWDSPLGTSLGPINSNDRSGVGLAAVNGNGTLGGAVWRQRSGGSEAVQTSRLTVRTAPSAPRAVTAQAVSDTAVLVTWQASEFDGNWPFPDYAAIPEPNSGVGCSTISTTCLVTSLQPGQTYRFFVLAENIEGSSKSELSDAVTMPGGTAAPPVTTNPAPPPSTNPSPSAAPTPAPWPPATSPNQPATPGAIAKVRVKAGKKSGKRKRKVTVRWSAASGATGYRVRITKPGGKRWLKWTRQSATAKRFRLVAPKRYKVAVVPVAGTMSGKAAVKKFRLRR